MHVARWLRTMAALLTATLLAGSGALPVGAGPRPAVDECVLAGGGDGIPTASGCPPSVSPFCVEDLRERHVQVIYARAPDGEDRYELLLPDIRAHVKLANGVVYREGLVFGRDIRFRMACEADGEVSVRNVVIGSMRDRDPTWSSFSILAELKAQGYDRNNVKYLVVIDRTLGGGGWAYPMYYDSRPGPENANNNRVAYAVVGKPNFEVMIHELGHTLGAVQANAPHSQPNGHCNEGQDYMCYSDWWQSEPRDARDLSYNGLRCTDREYFDCGYDDYFNPDPPPGSYLDRHWNLGRPANGFFEFRPLAAP
ncbi:MAG TPA: hypothetical protein VM681_03760 [Candidatus Thermoplasmatota archaeon]|nr:hypothetical protein [Candidatus Thermoplasmatota archaeon]